MLDLSYKNILRVAVPLMLSTFIQSIVLITDAAFLSRHSLLAFDASGNGGLIYVTMFAAMMGMSDGVQILIARRIGENNGLAVGRIFGTAVGVLAGIALILFCIIQWIIPSMLQSYTLNQDLAEAQISFLNIRSFALFFAIINLSIQAFFFALGKTWVVMVSAVIVAFSNILMDYLFIFGAGAIPEMGLEGAALASSLAEGIGMLFLFFYLVKSSERKKYQLFAHFRFQWKSFVELLKLGTPLFAQAFLAIATWTVFFSWIEQMGKDNLTISQNIRAIYFLAFVPIFGFAATTKTYISYYLGKGDFDSLKIIQRRIQILSFIFLFLFFHGAVLYPEKLISIINPSEAHLAKSADVLRFVSGSIFIFGLISVPFQTVNGSGNTRISLLIELICVSLYISSAYLFIKVLQLDLKWVWGVEYIYFSSLGIFSILYLRFSNWKQKTI